MYCQKCGSQIEDGLSFCTNCGARQTEGINDLKKNSSNSQSAQTNSSQQPANSQYYQTGYAQQPTDPANAYPYQNVLQTNKGVTFGEAIKLFFKNYVNFTGRSSKGEYWFAFLFNFLAMIPIYILCMVFPPLGGLCELALMLPGLSLAIRRLHDTGKSWVYILMGLIPLAGSIILIVQFCKDSEGNNKWGPAPTRK